MPESAANQEKRTRVPRSTPLAAMVAALVTLLAGEWPPRRYRLPRPGFAHTR